MSVFALSNSFLARKPEESFFENTNITVVTFLELCGNFTLFYTADCLLREPSELFNSKETTEHDERVNEPSYVLWRVIFAIADMD